MWSRSPRLERCSDLAAAASQTSTGLPWSHPCAVFPTLRPKLHAGSFGVVAALVLSSSVVFLNSCLHVVIITFLKINNYIRDVLGFHIPVLEA